MAMVSHLNYPDPVVWRHRLSLFHCCRQGLENTIVVAGQMEKERKMSITYVCERERERERQMPSNQ